ncbi:hypothetical protein [Micromonospora okii]|uniref:hypothetical protein n=1 Tax=Micromonospora okii TaxID=1182970 RepID=UPI001E5BFC25|nr:hypothetical protein [Micromonospora okii]
MSKAGPAERRTTLTITLRHPAATFLYGATKPRVKLDGEDVAIGGWGRHTIAVSPGQHRMEVWVPYVLPRKAGRASREFGIDEGADVALEYMAPTITLARGALGAPGEQKSTGYSAVMILNVVAVLVVLGVCAALALS